MEYSIAYYTEHPEMLNQSTLAELRTYVSEYPYFHAARLLYLHNLYVLHDSSFGEEMRKFAPLIPDRGVLYEIVEGESKRIKFIVPPPAPVNSDDDADRTASLIDLYLVNETDLPSQPQPKRQLTVADATTDYAAYLLQMEDAEIDAPTTEQSKRSSDLINDFIGGNNGKIVLPPTDEELEEPEEVEPENAEKDEDYFTETLAKIYIQQGRYEKAIEIIRKLNANFPKKNRYFADQIRFLQKLVINNQTNK